MTRMAQPAPIVVERPHSGELQREAFARRVTAFEKVLWYEGSSRASMLHLTTGAELKTHSHLSSVHHIWVVSGSCTIGGQPVQAGCYVFVPAGVAHRTKAGIEGCTLFYLILPEGQGAGARADP